MLGSPLKFLRELGALPLKNLDPSTGYRGGGHLLMVIVSIPQRAKKIIPFRIFGRHPKFFKKAAWGMRFLVALAAILC